MWIVRLALRRTYTFVVMAIVIGILGAMTVIQTPKDVFPEINIPVVSVIWLYGGLSPEEMEGRIVSVSERAMTTTVNGIEHIESNILAGASVTRVYFQPGTNISAATAEVTSIMQTILRIMPPGATPPLILRYSASNVPVLQVGLSSRALSEQQIYDVANNVIRTNLVSVPGSQVPLPFGGKSRQVMVDIDPEACFAKGLSPSDVATAVNLQVVVLPAGTAKIGGTEYSVKTNSSPDVLDMLNNVPIRQIGNSTVYLKDVAQVRDGFAPQTSMVHTNGRTSALLTILKSSGYSTLDIVAGVKGGLARIKNLVPESMEMKPLFDQSVFVRASLVGVLLEGAIAAGLTAMMILLFLGSWRSTIVIAVSIPLSILCSIVILAAMGQTLNVMTLGGLALAVGILVDDATVEIENVNRHLAMDKGVTRAILDGAQEIATPAFVSTLCICIVFTPVLFISGAAKYLFTPLALAVVFAMLASYFLSRTVVPTMVHYLLPAEAHLHQVHGSDDANHFSKGGLIWAMHQSFNVQFEKFRSMYVNLLTWALRHRWVPFAVLGIMLLSALLILPRVGQDFFPTIDAGQMRLHVRCPPGTRIEETEKFFGAVTAAIKEVVPASEIETVIDNIGIPGGGVNLAFSDTSTVGPADGEVLVQLKKGHRPTGDYVAELRRQLPRKFPTFTFYFQAADIVTQILNFGLPAQVNIQIAGRDPKNREIAASIMGDLRAVPGIVDVRLQQVLEQPELGVNVDRSMAQVLNLTQRDVASSLLVSLTGTSVTAPNYWLDPRIGFSYPIVTQTPQYRIDSVDALNNTPILSADRGRSPQLLTNLATVMRRVTLGVISHYRIQRTLDVQCSVQGTDLGTVGAAVDKVVAQYTGDPKDPSTSRLPRTTMITVKGQVEAMRESNRALATGLVFAVLLVYLLMVVNFQSWLDPFIILTALPGALVGIIWMLFTSQTTLSVPSLMGSVMCIGVATANSILLVTFANEQRHHNLSATEAALAAGATRLRPVLMTALAMIMGMLPMSLGLGEGGEQNAPLGRAVIGGLLVATFTTLLFVPVVYSLLRGKSPVREIEPELQ